MTEARSVRLGAFLREFWTFRGCVLGQFSGEVRGGENFAILHA
jgi:hypothetical protein